MTNKELYQKLQPSKERLFRRAYMTDHGLEINIEEIYSAMIKDAARCNSYNGDVRFDIRTIENALEEFNPNEEFVPIWVGFRRMGVDGTSYVLATVENDYPWARLSGRYFALYSFNIVEAEDDHYDIVWREYAV